MTPVEIARRLAGLGQTEKACQAYTLVIHQNQSVEPIDELEAAIYLFQFGSDYKVSYTSFVSLYNRGHFRETILPIMTQAFLEPNEKLFKSRYEKNCKRLAKYPWLFRKDFPAFEELPVRFYPYDEKGYLPFDTRSGDFGAYTDPRRPVVSRHFFKNLEDPILATDVFSQYELEYLYDNVRKSEWVARDNHIYLHYTDWAVFCSWLQVLNLRPVLEDKKIVFLFGDEIEQYPIDFKERFGEDYSRFPVKPVGIREITRLIWNCQLSSHNGIDFFNEILDGHPDLLCSQTWMFDDFTSQIAEAREELAAKKLISVNGQNIDPAILTMTNLTEKDTLIAILQCQHQSDGKEEHSRITPAVLFQPHFKQIYYDLDIDNQDRTVLFSAQYEEIKNSGFFRQFKYVKTFCPLRRVTTSHAAALKFMLRSVENVYQEKQEAQYIIDAVSHRVLVRNYLVDPTDRLFQDSVIVRFEDGKLNPRATFTALAAFLDIPYTESMTYCSRNGERDPETLAGNVRGFDPAPVYRTYEEYINSSEGYFIEYFMRDMYEVYGYDFHYYDGEPVDKQRVAELLEGFECSNRYIFQSWERLYRENMANGKLDKIFTPEEIEEKIPKLMDERINIIKSNRELIANNLLRSLRFVGKNGQPLRMLPLLKLDPELLEQPLYR